MRLAPLALAAGALAACPSEFGGAAVPRLAVDLSAAPEDRWAPVVEAVIAAQGDDVFADVFAYFNASLFDHMPPEVFLQLDAAVEEHFPEQALELQGMAAAIGVSRPYLSAWSWYHDLSHTEWADCEGTQQFSYGRRHPHRDCSGLLAADANGRVVHGRNHDNDPADLARKLVLRLDFGGEFETIGWYWFGLQFETAVKAGAFTLEENWRFPCTTSAAVLQAAEDGVPPQGYLYRRLLNDESVATFDDAVKYVATTPAASGFYGILSGPGHMEGAVVSRLSPGETASVQPVVLLAENATDGWFLVQTNYDRDLPDPLDDDRRTVAIEALREQGRALSSTDSGILCVASTPPVLNGDTLFSVVMHADSGIEYAKVRTDAQSHLGQP